MAKILCIDASTEACSVALLAGEETLSFYQMAPRQHASLILPQVEQLLKQADLALTQLDAIACNVGPGAFTGIRIAVAVSQGLAYGADLPTIELSSLENLAIQGFTQQSEIQDWLVAMDARMNEVYFGAYHLDQVNQLTPLQESVVIPPSQIDWQSLSQTLPIEQFGLIGSGWQAYQQAFFQQPDMPALSKTGWIQDQFPNAAYSLSLAARKFELGQLLAAQDLQPLYLRNQVAEKAK